LFIGHYAVGFAAKRFAPRASLGLLIAAPTLLDLLWPIFVLTGLEEVWIAPGNTRFTPLDFVSYPISHSLVAAIAWATIFAVLYFWFSNYWRGSVVVWIGVASHWILDLIVHTKDLPLYAGGPKFGFGLWNHPKATVAIEVLMYAFSIWIYQRLTRAKDWKGNWGFWAFVVVLAAFYVANIFAGPPKSVKVLAIGAIVFGSLLVVWAWWFDSHREVRT
jgi:hypothetical protein